MRNSEGLPMTVVAMAELGMLVAAAAANIVVAEAGVEMLVAADEVESEDATG